jgi:hypothetical protein
MRPHETLGTVCALHARPWFEPAGRFISATIAQWQLVSNGKLLCALRDRPLESRIRDY